MATLTVTRSLVGGMEITAQLRERERVRESRKMSEMVVDPGMLGVEPQ